MRPMNEIKLFIEEMEKTADTPFKRGWISALEWAMVGEGSAMCEANSNAVLAEVRALRERNGKLTDIINWMSNGFGIDHMESEYDIEMAEIESEHFS